MEQLLDGVRVVPVYQDGAVWRRGPKLRLVKVGRETFVRTDDECTPRDDLGVPIYRR